MKFNLTALSVLVVLFGFSQEITPVKKRKFQIGISGSIDQTTKTQNDYISLLGFSSEVYFSSRKNTKTKRFQVGILYSQINYKTKHLFDGTQTEYDAYFVYYRNISFLELPLKYNYFLHETNKINLYGTLGISVGGILTAVSNGYNYSTNTNDLMYTKPPHNIDPYNKGIIGFYLGVGLEYFLNKKISLTFDPEVKIKYQMELLGPDIYSAMGVNLGIRWNY